MRELGIHYIVDLHKCNEEKIKDNKKIIRIMDEVCSKAKLSVVTKEIHEFNPYGISGAYILKESHFTIHTWPEYKYVAIDLFFCDFSIDFNIIKETLEKEFESGNIKVNKLIRG